MEKKQTAKEMVIARSVEGSIGMKHKEEHDYTLESIEYRLGKPFLRESW